MGKNTTLRHRCGAAPALLLAVATACTTNSEPDPQQARRQLALADTPAIDRSDEGPVPVVESLDADTPASAPATETRQPSAPADRDAVVVVLGRSAAHAVDPTAQSSFASANPSLDSAFQACADRDAIETLMVGRADFGLIAGKLTTRDQQAGLRQTRLGLELFALVVPADAPMVSLSRQQLRQVLTGQVTEWQRLGYDAGQVMVVAPVVGELAERAARTLIPGDDFASAAVRAAGDDQVLALVRREPGAIGVVRVHRAPLPEGLRLLKIDWTPATAETYGYGTYPFGVPLHLVTSGQPQGPGQQFLQWAHSDDGRELLGRTLLLP